MTKPERHTTLVGWMEK